MHQHIKTTAMAAACALLLAACGGSSHDDPAPAPAPQPQPPVVVAPPEPVVTRLELLSSSARAMDSVAFYGGAAYVSLANSKTEGSAVLRAALPRGCMRHGGAGRLHHALAAHQDGGREHVADAAVVRRARHHG